jgi:hypothetical protein
VGIDEWILLVVKLSGRALTTRIQKVMFILWKERRVGEWELYFFPYKYGPWSYEVSDALKKLVGEGALAVETEQRAREGRAHTGVVRVYSLTERGRAAASGAERRALLKSPLAYLTARKWARAPLEELIAYVYERYPEYTTRSLLIFDYLRLAERHKLLEIRATAKAPQNCSKPKVC